MNNKEQQRLITEKMYRRYTSTNKSLLEQVEGLDKLITLDGVPYIEYIDYLIRFLVDKNIEKATKDKAISIVTQLRAKMETETNDINAAKEAGISPKEIIERRMFVSSATDKPDLSYPLPPQKTPAIPLAPHTLNWLEEINYRKIQDREQRLRALKRRETKQIGHVYFYESAGNFKIGKSCCQQIQKRLLRQRPDKVIAVSEASNNYHKLEKDLHREYASKRMGRYEIFCGLTKTEIKKIQKKLGCCEEIVQSLNKTLQSQKLMEASS